LAYLYRAVDSAGETIEFMLSPKRDLIAATMFLRLALSGEGPSPRVINVDGHPAYASAVADLNQTGELGRHCRVRLRARNRLGETVSYWLSLTPRDCNPNCLNGEELAFWHERRFRR
jgi:transposase-like protein